MGGHVRRG